MFYMMRLFCPYLSYFHLRCLGRVMLHDCGIFWSSSLIFLGSLKLLPWARDVGFKIMFLPNVILYMLNLKSNNRNCRIINYMSRVGFELGPGKVWCSINPRWINEWMHECILEFDIPIKLLLLLSLLLLLLLLLLSSSLQLFQALNCVS